MDATLMFSASATPAPAPATHASATAASAAQTANGVELSGDPGRVANTPNGRIFAGLMRGLLPTHERQDVAAATETTVTETGDLKTEVLGEQLSLITTSNALPDPSSLSAFARAQGLDEAAVKALFGEMAAPTQVKSDAAAALTIIPSGLDPATTAATPAAPSDLAWLASQLSAEISMQISGLKNAATAPSARTSGPTLPSAILVTSETPSATMMDWAAMANAVPLSPVALGNFGTSPSQGPDAGVSQMPTGNGLGSATGLTSALSSPSALTATAVLPLTLAPVNLPGVTPAPVSPAPVLTSPTAFTAPSLLPLTLAPVNLPGATPAPVMPAPVLTAALSPAPVLTAAAVPALPLDLQGSAKAEATASTGATEALDLLAPAQPLPQDAMRIRLVPAWALVTQQLTQMSGTAMTSAWGALTATTLGAPIRAVALDLTSPLAADSEDALAVGSTDSGWSTQGSETARTPQISPPLPSAAPTPGMAQTLRQEHYQQLADRLGQAMAERLQSQIARGEWKLQMRLNPANLGRIDVELDMHAKGLDAMFRSENPLTRELMVQSMPKLKETLSQSGMAVASVWVNSDAGRQSDGNPTPQRDRTDVINTPKSAQAEIGVSPASQPKRSTDGFDVLA